MADLVGTNIFLLVVSVIELLLLQFGYVRAAQHPACTSMIVPCADATPFRVPGKRVANQPLTRTERAFASQPVALARTDAPSGQVGGHLGHLGGSGCVWRKPCFTRR